MTFREFAEEKLRNNRSEEIVPEINRRIIIEGELQDKLGMDINDIIEELELANPESPHLDGLWCLLHHMSGAMPPGGFRT